jgi:predicted O-linked N-acetylglucosamine transferase (SPINDLY family)
MASVAELAPALVASGLAHQREGRLSPAENCYLAALRIDPANAQATYLMGVLALQSGNGEGAKTYLSRVIAARTGDPDALYNMGMAHVLALDPGEAEPWFRKALAVDPDHTAAHFALGNLDRLLLRGEAWPAHYLAGIRSAKATPEMASTALVALHSNPGVSLEALYALHREWERRFAAAAYAHWQSHSNDRSPDRPLRVGFVSSGFNARIVGHFLRGVIRALTVRADIEAYLYANSATTDWLTAELQQSRGRWRDIVALDDHAAAARVRADCIDILIDLNGHAPGHRLLVFALRPAPVQVSWLDYFDTTGLEAIDYLITDPVSSPADGAQRFVERLIHMPSVRLCFSAPPFAPAVAPSPALRRGRIAFGSFTRADKIGASVVAVWARILAAVPGSTLILKGETLKFPLVRTLLERSFSEAGIAPERLDLRTPSSHEELLAEYADVDVALDPFPYNGGATTCDAMWMGVPVVARLGTSMISRQSAMMLHAVGLKELVARDDDEYVGIAARIASDLPRLHSLRQELRPAMAASPLCDAEGFAEALAQRLRRAWQSWCRI